MIQSVGSTISGNQHAGIFQHNHLFQPSLLASAIRNSSRRAKYLFRPRIISSDLLHRKSRAPSHDDLVSKTSPTPLSDYRFFLTIY